MKPKIYIKGILGILCALLIVTAMVGSASAQTTITKKVRLNKYLELKAPIYENKTQGYAYDWNYAYDHSKLNLYIDQDGNIIIKPLKKGKTEIIVELKETNISNGKTRTIQTIKYIIHVQRKRLL